MSRKLKQIFAAEFSEEELKALVGGFDIVGDMAIIIVPHSLERREQEIGEAILKINKKIKVVAKRSGQYSGEFRTIGVQIIAGEPGKETEVKEFGVRLLLNPEEVYFSVRSGNERKRIASLVHKGENVLVLCSGIGPFPLLISKFSEANSIVAIEKNRAAHDYAVKNLHLNKKLNNIELHHGDVVEVVPKLKRLFDRVLLVLPTSGGRLLSVALQSLKAGGHLHFYDMQKVDRFEDSVAKVVAAVHNQEREVVTASVIKCGHCAPKTYRICVDAHVG